MSALVLILGGVVSLAPAGVIVALCWGDFWACLTASEGRS